MARYNAMEETFTEVRVLGKPAFFHDLRIDRSTVPKGLYLYEVRHDDEGWGDPVQIAKGIMVNHFGSIITRRRGGGSGASYGDHSYVGRAV